MTRAIFECMRKQMLNILFASCMSFFPIAIAIYLLEVDTIIVLMIEMIAIIPPITENRP